MPRNSSGTYTLPAGNPVVTNTLIETNWANPTMSDLGSTLTDSLDRFGRGGMLAALRGPDGAPTAPSYSFSSETTSGFFRPSAGTLALAVAGVSRFLLTASLLTVNVPATFASTATFTGAVTFSGGATLTGPIVIDKLYSKASANQPIGGITPDWEMAGTTLADSTTAQTRWVNAAGGPSLMLGHSRGTSVGTHAALTTAGDQFGNVEFFGSDGTAFRSGARIIGEADGTPGAGDMPGRIRFLTTPAGTVTPTEVLRLSQDNSATFFGITFIPNGTAGAPSQAFTNSPTTGIFRQSTDVIGFATAGVERWRINAAGVLAATGGAAAVNITRVGTTNVTPIAQWSGATLPTVSAGGFGWDNASAGMAPHFTMARARSAAVGTHGLVASGDLLGRVTAAGSDGVKFVEAGRINFICDGTPGVDDMPGRIEFATTADGAATPTIALTLGSDNRAVFAGQITAPNATIAGDTLPHVLVNRTGAAVNAVQEFRTTSGGVFIGQGAALTFAVDGDAAMQTGPWLSQSATAFTSVGTGRFNGATQGFLGILEGGTSGATANASADTLVLEGNNNVGISFCTPNTTGVSGLYWCDPESNSVARISYNHTNNTFTTIANGASAFTWNDLALTLSGGVELILNDGALIPTTVTSAGFRGIPQNSQSAAYTLVLSDAGKHILHPAADATARTFTIPANATVPFPVGTSITFINGNGAGVVTIAITTDTMRLAGSGATGSRTLAANGIATAVKIVSNAWIISGTGLT